jgi:asparagine synthase (glutamine-hydrolysing)
MTSSLVHRGPDEDGVHVDGDLALGMRRLQVIDPAGGHQPMRNEDGTVQVVFNGEIYNFPELRRKLEGRGHRFATNADTEVIVHLYEDAGPGCVERLNGMFAFALWDEARRELLLARDRFGKKPLYYAEVEGSLLFGSEVKALLEHPHCPCELDFEALSRYLALEYVPTPYSIFAGVQKLPAITHSPSGLNCARPIEANSSSRSAAHITWSLWRSTTSIRSLVPHDSPEAATNLPEGSITARRLGSRSSSGHAYVSTMTSAARA